MYHPKAAVRSSGGVAVFVQEAVRALAPERSVYLYSEGGEFTRTIQSSDVRVVTFERDRAWANLRELTPDVPFTPTWASNQLSESVVAFVNAARGSTLRHVEQQVDVLYTHNLVDTALLSNAVDVPVVRLFHSCQHVSRPGTVIDALSRPAARVANSDQTAREVATKLGHEVDWTV